MNHQISRELITMNVIRIDRNPSFDFSSFVNNKGNKCVVFYYDREVKRNKYIIIQVGQLLKSNDKRLYFKLDEEGYRGHVEINGHGELPMFTYGFVFPLYKMEAMYKVFDKTIGKEYYEKVVSPMTFKLKDKEDRLCFDSVIKEYEGVAELIKDKWSVKRYVKAMKMHGNAKTTEGGY